MHNVSNNNTYSNNYIVLSDCNDELSNNLVGFVLFFWTYSTWEGRSVYMEVCIFILSMFYHLFLLPVIFVFVMSSRNMRSFSRTYTSHPVLEEKVLVRLYGKLVSRYAYILVCRLFLDLNYTM